MKASEVAEELKTSGITFLSGVACSLLAPLIEVVTANDDFTYIPAPRENLALGLSSGAWLGGRAAGVIMQNSGLGHITNALTSFNLIYKIPVLLVIGWRGYDPDDAPEHTIMGPATPKLLDLLGVRYRSLEAPSDVSEMADEAQRSSLPAALLVKPRAIV